MEELTEVITAAEFHPNQCNTFIYSSSKGSIRLCDMRAAALCDNHCKCKFIQQLNISVSVCTLSNNALGSNSDTYSCLINVVHLTPSSL